MCFCAQALFERRKVHLRGTGPFILLRATQTGVKYEGTSKDLMKVARGSLMFCMIGSLLVRTNARPRGCRLARLR